MTPTNSRLLSGKIQTRHRALQALVYVRQSSLQQVHDHPESRARQYALAAHAVALGWPADQVVVIDEDQGPSGPIPGPDSNGFSPTSRSAVSG